MEGAAIKAEADEQMEALRNQLEDQTSTSHDANARQRDELDGTSPVHLPQ